jgi:hypothetical protein
MNPTPQLGLEARVSETLAQPKRTLADRLKLERLVWFWTDVVVGKSGISPEWLAFSLLLFLYLSATLVALLAGQWDVFVRDFRWLVSYVGIAASAYYIAYLPKEIDRLWLALRPWIANESQLNRLKDETRTILAKPVIVCFPIWIVFSAIWAATNSWAIPYDAKWVPQLLNAMFAPFLWYFAGVAMGISTMGVRSLIRRIALDLEFKPGVVYPMGRQALQPFNRVLFGNWTFFVLVTLCATIATTPWSGDAADLRSDGYTLPDFLLWALFGAIGLLLVSCQRSLDVLLGRVKASTLADLNQRFNDAAELPDNSSIIEVLRRTHLTNVIQYEIQKVETFSPTLVDGRFALQVCLSASAIIIANILLRLAIEGV